MAGAGVIPDAAKGGYQSTLRALGAYLDQEPSCRISVVETTDGFLVRTQPALHKLEPAVLHFRRDALVPRTDSPQQGQGRLQRKAQPQGIWSTFPNSHEDFLRALGFELDEASASAILLDELEDGIFLTYTYRENANSVSWAKRVLLLGVSQIEEILNEAFNRRRATQSQARPPSSD